MWSKIPAPPPASSNRRSGRWPASQTVTSTIWYWSDGRYPQSPANIRGERTNPAHHPRSSPTPPVGPGYDGQWAPGPTPPLPPPRGQGVKKRRCRQGDTPPSHALPPPPLGSQAGRVGVLGCNSWTRPLFAPPPRVLSLPGQVSLEGGTSPSRRPPPQLQHLLTPSPFTSVMSLWVSEHAFPSRTMLDTKRLASSVAFRIRPLQALLRLDHFRPEDVSVGEIAINQLSVRLVPKQSTHTSPPRSHRPTSPPSAIQASSPSVPPLAKKRENAAVSSNSLEKWKTTQIGPCPSHHHLPLAHRQRDHPLHDRHCLYRLNRSSRHLIHCQRRYQQRRRH